jgi:hypothetical protein
VNIWSHKITLVPHSDGNTYYTDEVAIGAVKTTGLIALWAKAFYGRRQKKWRKICEGLRNGKEDL